jgi:hypothetical protein
MCPTRGDHRPDLIRRDQQHEETVVGVERSEVLVAADLGVVVLLRERSLAIWSRRRARFNDPPSGYERTAAWCRVDQGRDA